ncbi:MAG TPA: DUF3540 domain-containing protein [Minicystis sp.]|nr:DUF3540 domain-containing protein [Minicystis sp.]
MEQSIKKIRRRDAYLEEAHVVASNAGAFSVAAGDVRAEARRAVGCLVEPLVGDRVLVAWIGADAYVVTVLAREGDAPPRLSAERDLEIAAPRGKIALTARDAVDLATAGEVSVVSRAFALHAPTASVVVERLKALGTAAEAQFERVTTFASRLERVADVVRERARQAFRDVEGLDQVRAGELDVRASRVAHVHAKHTLLTADELVKLDGDQVHLG